MATWTVRALKWHTYKGVAYNETDIYTVEEADDEALEIQLNTLQAEGMAHRNDPVDHEDLG